MFRLEAGLCTHGLDIDAACQDCDWCKNCERITVWHGEFCRRCKTPWGFDSRDDWAAQAIEMNEDLDNATLVHRFRILSNGDGWTVDAWNVHDGHYTEQAADFDTFEEAWDYLPDFWKAISVLSEGDVEFWDLRNGPRPD